MPIDKCSEHGCNGKVSVVMNEVDVKTWSFCDKHWESYCSGKHTDYGDMRSSMLDKRVKIGDGIKVVGFSVSCNKCPDCSCKQVEADGVKLFGC